MKHSRRQFLRLLGASPIFSAAVFCRAETAARASAKPAPHPVIVQRILIPAKGMTIPAVLARPAGGRHPATILLGAHLADERALLHRCARLAAEGRVLVAPLRMRERDAYLTAIRQYLNRHPAALSAPKTLST